MSTLGILGAGKVGTTLARLAVATGRQVVMSGSPRQPMQALIVETVVPGARLVPEAEVVERADIVVVAVPFGKTGSVGWERLSGKVVVDVTNYWYPVDGPLDEVEHADGSTSELLRSRNPRMRLVKSLNHLGYHDMETGGRPGGFPLRRSVAVASDDASARLAVAALVDDIGFDPVLTGLAQAVHLEPEGPVFGRALTAPEMVAAIQAQAGAGTATLLRERSAA